MTVKWYHSSKTLARLFVLELSEFVSADDCFVSITGPGCVRGTQLPSEKMQGLVQMNGGLDSEGSAVVVLENRTLEILDAVANKSQGISYMVCYGSRDRPVSQAGAVPG